MTGRADLAALLYLLAGVLFILALKGLASPATSRAGNRNGMAGMTIAYDDHPLAPEQVQGEQNRLAGLVGDPEQLKHKHSQEQETADRTLRIVKALPEAFLYEYMPDGTANPTKDASQLVRLKFRPNPEYHAPSHVEQVLEGMQGFLVIDRTCCKPGTPFTASSIGRVMVTCI